MVVLIGLSIYAFGVIFYKFYQFAMAGVWNTKFVDYAMQPIKRGELTEAMRMLAPVKSPVARMMRVSIHGLLNRNMSVKSRESEIARIAGQDLRYLESHMRGLEMVATTAPLLGLLGTVIGMVRAFSKLGEAGSRVDPSVLAGGIWEALLTTVGGLMVAIPAIAAYYIIDSIIERVRASMQDATTQVLAMEDAFLNNKEEQQRIAQHREREVERRRIAEEQQRHQAELEQNRQRQQAELEQRQRQQLELEQRQRQQLEMEQHQRQQAEMEQRQHHSAEIEQREEYWRRVAEEQERTIESMRGSQQASDTLRLLNPTYRY